MIWGYHYFWKHPFPANTPHFNFILDKISDDIIHILCLCQRDSNKSLWVLETASDDSLSNRTMSRSNQIFEFMWQPWRYSTERISYSWVFANDSLLTNGNSNCFYTSRRKSNKLLIYKHNLTLVHRISIGSSIDFVQRFRAQGLATHTISI